MINCPHNGMPQRFKVRITPPHDMSEVVLHSQCIYGVSIGTPKSLADLVAGYDWARAHFKRCAILLGDGLYRITLQTREGLDETTAARRAIAEGTEVMRGFASSIGTEPEIFRSSSLMLRPEFGMALARIDSLYESDRKLRSSIDSGAAEFVERQIQNGRLAVSREEATRLSVRYVREEIAVYLLLAEAGWLVDVYLGRELPTLARIIGGEIPAAPQKLKDRINIALTAK